MLDLLKDGFIEFFNLANFIYLNIGLLLGIIFGAIPGLTVMLCLVLFLPFTYALGPIPSFMFLLGIYCAGSYGGSISAILIKTPGTPHATATMLDGYPMAQKGYPKKALQLALEASTFGGLFSAFVLLFLAPTVAKFAMKIGSPEYFLICLFGLTIISGISGKSLVRGIISGCVGLFISIVGMDLISGGVTRFTFDNVNLYGGFDLVIVLIGLFALIEIMSNGSKKVGTSFKASLSDVKEKKDRIEKKEYKRLLLPAFVSSVFGVIIGIIPGTGASMASFLSYDTARKMSKHPEEFGNGSSEAIVAAESANNAVTGATLIPLLTLGIPGDGAVAIMLGALMVNSLTPGPNLFVEHGTTMYAIMIGLIFINIFMYLQGKYLTKLFAKVVSIPTDILTPIIVVFCFAGAYSIKKSLFDVAVAIVFGIIAYILKILDFPTIPILLGLVLGGLTEKNFRRSLLISNGDISIFFTRPISLFFVILIVAVVGMIIYNNYKLNKKTKKGQSHE